MDDVDESTVATAETDTAEALVLPLPAEDPFLEARRAWAQELVERAKADGLELVGPDGLLADVARDCRAVR